MKTVNTSWKRLFSFLCTILLLFTVPTVVLAESQSKTSVRKSTKAKSTKAKKTRSKASAKKAPPALVVIDEAVVQSSFDTFTQDWMKKLAEAEEYHRKELIKVSQSWRELLSRICRLSAATFHRSEENHFNRDSIHWHLDVL